MTQVHLPFMVLPLIAAPAARDPDHERPALSFGASRVETFLRVTLPLSIPGIAAGCAIVFALYYSNFIIPQLRGGGNYATLGVSINNEGGNLALSERLVGLEPALAAHLDGGRHASGVSRSGSSRGSSRLIGCESVAMAPTRTATLARLGSSVIPP